jgi:hypothetical protein
MMIEASLEVYSVTSLHSTHYETFRLGEGLRQKLLESHITDWLNIIYRKFVYQEGGRNFCHRVLFILKEIDLFLAL